MKSFLRGKKVLVTGGSGSIGSELVSQLLQSEVDVVRVFSRDETRQTALSDRLQAGRRVRFLIGDVRDRDRLRRALEGIDYVFHAAALKQVPVCEYNPFEAVQTNVLGTQHIVTASREAGVKRVVLISTDKSVSPNNTMGATKLLAEKLVSAAHTSMAGMTLCAVRFGNVLGSRGSLLPVIRRRIHTRGEVLITARGMTRFFMTVQKAARLVIAACEKAEGGEIFVLPMPKVRVEDLVKVVIEKECEASGWDPDSILIREIGVRPGEKLHERLLAREETERSYFQDGLVVIPPLGRVSPEQGIERPCERDFCSETGPFLSRNELIELLKEASGAKPDFELEEAGTWEERPEAGLQTVPARYLEDDARR